MPDEYAQALLTFLPAYLVRQAATGTSLAQWEERFPAAVLMADISGFTPLAEALALLIDNGYERRRMGRQSRRLAEREFAWEYIAEQYVRVYEQVIG